MARGNGTAATRKTTVPTAARLFGKRKYPGSVIGEVLGLTTQRVSQLAQQRTFTRHEDGYDLIECVQAYAGMLKKRRGSDDQEQEHKSRLAKAKADIAELEAARVRREQIPIEDIHNAWSEILRGIRSRMITIGSLAPRLIDAETIEEARHILESWVHEHLETLANRPVVYGSPEPGDPDAQGDEDAAPPAKADRQPVG